jgi:hypothetical protein
MSDGLLVKLTITPFEDSENIQVGSAAGSPWVAQFNPESLTVDHDIEYGPDEPAQGDVAGEAKFKGIKPRTFSFDFLLDGTGASGPPMDVLAQLTLFRQTTGFLGKTHQPHFLVISWGAFIATCVLESFSVTYKLFRPEGTPLRATLSAKFREHTSEKLKELVKNLSSPDISHAHLVKEGEHLSLITYQVYKDPAYYYQVAEANNLNTLRVIQPGKTLHMPPVE